MTTERDGDVLIARVEGRIDGATTIGFEEAVRTALGDGDRALLIDCTELRFLSSAGLRVMLILAKALSARNVGFALCSLSEPIRGVFRTSGFDKVVAIHPSRAEARAALGS